MDGKICCVGIRIFNFVNSDGTSGMVTGAFSSAVVSCSAAAFATAMAAAFSTCVIFALGSGNTGCLG